VAADPVDADRHKFRAFVNEHGPNGFRYGRGFRARDAILGYMRALSLEPQDAGTHYNIGVIHGRRGFWKKAHESLLRALAIDSTHAGTRQVLPQVEAHLTTTDEKGNEAP
jgi:tetratricopeptide (TPR) repeat protein